jgi:hypothetical protein
MTEDNFEEFLKKAAQGYNVPPARTPREDMWSAIQAQRAAGPRVVYGGGSPAGESSVRRFGSRIWMGAAAAAMLLLATGVGIGRWSASSNTSGAVARVNPPASPASPVSPDSSDPQSSGGLPQGSGAVASSGSSVRGGETPAPGGVARSGGARQIDTNGGNGIGTSTAVTSVPSGNSASSSAYQLTAVKHLSEAEALLTSFRTRSTTDQQMDAQLGSWARELLNKTRLLMDSPVANDPQRRPLLEDLELVLVQIVQLSPGSTPQDRELIEKTLQQDHVMTRLRTAIPAGPQRGS